MANDLDLSPLKELHELLGDGRKGYQEAASKMTTPSAAELLEALSEEHRCMQNDLAEAIHHHGPRRVDLDHSTLKGSLHRRWMNLRQATTGKDESLLAECERGEWFLLDRYTNLLQVTKPPAPMVRLLREQMARIDEMLFTIQQLRSNGADTR